MSGALEKIRKFASAWRGFDNMFMNKVKLISAGNGSCSAEFTVQNEHTNPMGGLHGGISASLVDTVSSLALRTLLDEKVHVSVNINLTYLKGAVIGDEVVINARTLRTGKNLAYLEVDLKNKKTGDLLVKGSHTKYILNKSLK